MTFTIHAPDRRQYLIEDSTWALGQQQLSPPLMDNEGTLQSRGRGLLHLHMSCPSSRWPPLLLPPTAGAASMYITAEGVLRIQLLSMEQLIAAPTL